MSDKAAFPQNNPYLLNGNHHDLNQQLIKRVQSLEEELANLAANISEEAHDSRIARELEHQNQQLRNNMQDKQTQIAKLQAEIKQLRKKNHDIQDSIGQYKEQLEGLKRSRGDKRAGPELEEKILELNDQITGLVGKIEQLMNENSEQQTHYEALEGQLQLLEQQKQQLGKDLEEQRTYYMEQVEYLKQEITHVEEISLKQQQSLQNKYLQQLEEAQQQIKQLNNNIKQSNSTQAQHQLSSLRQALAQQQEQQLEQSQRYQQEIQELQTTLQQLLDQNRTIKTNINNIQAECQQYRTLVQQQQLTHTDIANMQMHVSQIQNERDRLIGKINQLQNKEGSRVNLRRQQWLQEQIRQLSDQLEQQKALVRSLKQDIRNNQQDYQNLLKEYQITLADHKEHFDQSELERHKHMYEALVQKYDRTAQLYHELEDKLFKYQQQRSNSSFSGRNHYDHNNSDLVYLQNSALKQENELLRGEIQKLRNSDKRDSNQQESTHIYTVKQLREQQNSHRRIQLMTEQIYQLTKQLQHAEYELSRCREQLKEERQEGKRLYLKAKEEFQMKGVRHHPDMKKMQNQLLMQQRQFMESELLAKRTIEEKQDQIAIFQLENNYHKNKIQQLIQQLSQSRTVNYGETESSQQLATLKIKQLNQEVDYKAKIIQKLQEQLNHYKERKKHPEQEISNPLEKQTINNITNSKQHFVEQDEPSRLEELTRERRAVQKQFQITKQCLEGGQSKQPSNGILSRLRQSIKQ